MARSRSTARDDTPDSPPESTARSSSSRRRQAGTAAGPRGDDVSTTPQDSRAPGQPTDLSQESDDIDIAADLSFREAQTALELSLAQLQSPDLDVEAMAGLYRRARRYADRCEQVLQQVEQEVMRWDPETPEQPPQPFQP